MFALGATCILSFSYSFIQIIDLIFNFSGGSYTGPRFLAPLILIGIGSITGIIFFGLSKLGDKLEDLKYKNRHRQDQA